MSPGHPGGPRTYEAAQGPCPGEDDELRRRAEEAAPEGTVLLAETQTRGRGRLNRSFYSPRQSGIYMSLLLRPTIDPRQSLLITTAAAVAVAEGWRRPAGE